MNWFWNGLVVTSASPGVFTRREWAYRGPSYGRPWPGVLVYGPWADREKIRQAVERERKLHARLYELVYYTFAERDDGLPTVPVVDNLSAHPAAVPDTGLVERYIRCLKKADVDFRVLLCATTSSYREMDSSAVESLLAQSVFLGYDYVGHDFEYSPLPGDLDEELSAELPEDPPRWLTREAYTKERTTLAQLAGRRNPSGLLNDDADLETYISAHWQIACPVLDQPPGQPDTSGACRLEIGEFWPCKVWEVRRI